MRHPFRYLTLMLCGVTLAGQATAGEMPRLRTENGRHALMVDGKPYLMVTVPAGRHTIELVLSETSEEYAGRITSGIGLAAILCLVGLSILRRRQVSPRSAGLRTPA